MPLNTAAKTIMLNALDGVIGRISLHTGAPGASGTANEVSGGSPAYARKTISCTVTGASMATDAAVIFDVPGGVTVTHVGFWSADGLTYYGDDDLSASESFASQGTYTIPSGQGTFTL
jgi:hypothetical protein